MTLQLPDRLEEQALAFHILYFLEISLITSIVIHHVHYTRRRQVGEHNFNLFSTFPKNDFSGKQIWFLFFQTKTGGCLPPLPVYSLQVPPQGCAGGCWFFWDPSCVSPQLRGFV